MRLGQITMAVAVQMLVDTVLMRHSPAEVAVPGKELHQKWSLGGEELFLRMFWWFGFQGCLKGSR